MKTSKAKFFKLLRKAALQGDQPVPEKSPRKSGDCNGKRTRQRTSEGAED